MAKKKSALYDDLKIFESIFRLPALKEAHEKWITDLNYQDLLNLEDLYEKEVDELALKLLRVRDEARCEQVILAIVMSAPEIVKALLLERYTTVLLLCAKSNNKYLNPTALGSALFGMLCLYHTFLRVDRSSSIE